jgi:hypothetical protein
MQTHGLIFLSVNKCIQVTRAANVTNSLFAKVCVVVYHVVVDAIMYLTRFVNGIERIVVGVRLPRIC